MSVRIKQMFMQPLIEKGAPWGGGRAGGTGENRELLIPDKGIYVFDDLIVLKTATSPAVLLEAAVIVNPDDDALAGSEKFRLAVAESVYEMLDILR